MGQRGWFHFLPGTSDRWRDAVLAGLEGAGLDADSYDGAASGPGMVFFGDCTDTLCEFVCARSAGGLERVLAVAETCAALRGGNAWRLLRAGAADVIAWEQGRDPVAAIAARLARWGEIDALVRSPLVRDSLIGRSPAWIATLRRVVEVATTSDAALLLCGESGTGKEMVARLIHALDPRPAKRDLVVVDCTTIVPELAGSELFGHERGAFTGAAGARDGAFALADGGTLFLDEVGELPLPLQAQLLRAVQERTFKRVGGNAWQRAAFRVVCATNRDLLEEVREGRFRRDLYYRIAGVTCSLPALRERPDDVLVLVAHFWREVRNDGAPLELDEAVRDHMLQRAYPGNVRDLRQLVMRFAYRHVGTGPVTAGELPEDERPLDGAVAAPWDDGGLDAVARRALARGASLKDITRAATEAAIRIAVREAEGSLQGAARLLRAPHATDEAQQVAAEDLPLRRGGQLERAHLRQLESGMQPGSVRAEQDLVRPSAAYRLDEQVEAPHAGGVCVDVWVARQRIEQRPLRLPVVGEAAEVGDDEGYVRVLVSEELDGRYLAHQVVQHRQRVRARHLAHLARDPRVIAMHLDTAKAVTTDRMANHLCHAATVACGMHEGEAQEAPGPARDDLRDLTVRRGIVGVERREQHGARDSCPRGAAQVAVERRDRIPGASEAVAVPGVAVAVDDHDWATPTVCVALRPREPTRLLSFASSVKNAPAVAMPRAKVGRWSFSFGACRRSSGRAKPMSTVGMPSRRSKRLTTGIVPPDRRSTGSAPKPRVQVNGDVDGGVRAEARRGEDTGQRHTGGLAAEADRRVEREAVCVAVPSDPRWGGREVSGAGQQWKAGLREQGLLGVRADDAVGGEAGTALERAGGAACCRADPTVHRQTKPEHAVQCLLHPDGILTAAAIDRWARSGFELFARRAGPIHLRR